MNQNDLVMRSRVIDNTPLADYTNIDREGLIIVRPAKPTPHKSESLTFSGFKGKLIANQNSDDSKVRNLKYWFGIPLMERPDGTYKFKKIQIIDGRMYHLHNEDDAIEWHILRHCMTIEGSPNLSGQARWIVEEERKTASKAIDKGTLFVRVFDFLNSMNDNKMKSFGRLFHLDPNNNTAEVIKGQLVKRAMETPEIFLQYIDDKEKTARHEIFRRALDTNVITHTIDRGYLFMGSVPIGLNESLVLEYLKKNTDMLVTMDTESRRRDDSFVMEIASDSKPGGDDDEEIVEEEELEVETTNVATSIPKKSWGNKKGKAKNAAK